MSTAKAFTQGMKDLTFWKTHTFPSNVVMLMFIFSRHRHHQSALSKPCVPILQTQGFHKQTFIKVSRAWLRSSYIYSAFDRVGYDHIVRVTPRENCLKVTSGIPLSSLREGKCVVLITKGGRMRKDEKNHSSHQTDWWRILTVWENKGHSPQTRWHSGVD